MKSKLFVYLALVATVLSFAFTSKSAFAEDDQERAPASQRRTQPTQDVAPRPQQTDTYRPTGAEPTDEPYRRDLPRDIIIPKFQYAAMLGVGLNSSDELNNDSYQHKTARSPNVLLGFHYAFFRQKHFNMLLGADVVYIRSVDVAQSSKATATYTSENWDGGVTLGLGWIPGKPNSKFQMQGKIGSGFNFSHTATLQSPGFTTPVNSQSATSNVFAFWAELTGIFAPTPNWRVLGTVLAINKTQSLLGGVAYAY